MSDPIEHVYSFAVEDFDASLLPPDARTPGTEAFREAVSRQIEQDFAAFTGWVRIVVSEKTIEVRWRQDPKRPTPMKVALAQIDRGDFAEAARILEYLRLQEPDNVQVLYNLGLVHSDLGQPELAVLHLRSALDVEPGHVDSMAALGVALQKMGQTTDAVAVLREAAQRNPDHLWAQRNLGAILLALGEIEEAAVHLQRAYQLNPQDQQAAFGYAQALQAKGDIKAAKDIYGKTIALDERSHIAELARQEQTKRAVSLFRRDVPEGVRADAVMYCMDAIEKFGKMTPEEVQKIGFEVAVAGRQGFDMDSADMKYTLKSLPGQFSGLNMVCLMYVAFRQTMPDQPIGFDLAREYEVAKRMIRGKDEE